MHFDFHPFIFRINFIFLNNPPQQVRTSSPKPLTTFTISLNAPSTLPTQTTHTTIGMRSGGKRRKTKRSTNHCGHSRRTFWRVEGIGNWHRRRARSFWMKPTMMELWIRVVNIFIHIDIHTRSIQRDFACLEGKFLHLILGIFLYRWGSFHGIINEV